MAILTAHYKISTPSRLIIEDSEEELFSYEIHNGEYCIRIQIITDKYEQKCGKVNSGIWRTISKTVEIYVSKDVGDIPSIPINKNGGRNFCEITDYFNSHFENFGSISRLYYNKIITFFKFNLHQPFLRIGDVDDDEFLNPHWSDSNGIDYGHVRYLVSCKSIPGLSISSNFNMDIIPLKSSDTDSLMNSLKSNNTSELYQQMLSDSQTAILKNDLRRGVFELAVTCELVAKRKYFSENNISGLAFDYFEDKGMAKVNIQELITSVALNVFGESFKEYSPDDYTNIIHLFRCRNKVAHRGSTTYKDDKGNTYSPDMQILIQWYMSVVTLIDWLHNKKI